MDESTFSLPFRDTFPLLESPSPKVINRTPPLLATDFNVADMSMNIDYYGEHLSPLDRPPTIARRPSIAASFTKPGMSSVSEWTSGLSTPSNQTITASHPKRRHTTCSIPTSQLSATNKLLSPELSWMLSSPRTTNYLNRYFTSIHPEYPILNKSSFVSPVNTSVHSLSEPIDLSNPTKTFTRLLAAGIGALIHHCSRDISARYVRHAMILAADASLDSSSGTMWNSISGIHAAMLLAIYCFLEQTTEFGTEDEDTSHPPVNLWLWNCRIAASCIDLGLHLSQGSPAASSSISRKSNNTVKRVKIETNDDMAEDYEMYNHASGGVYGGGMRIPVMDDSDDSQDAELENEAGVQNEKNRRKGNSVDNENDAHNNNDDEIEDQGSDQGSSDQDPPSDADNENTTKLSQLYRSTFRSAFVLDRRISGIRTRPFAIHVEDVGGGLIEDLL
jgi:hypothetical protein